MTICLKEKSAIVRLIAYRNFQHMGSTVKPTYLRMFFEKKYKQSNISRWKDIDILGDFFHDEVAEWLRRWTANPLGSPRVGSNPILVD